jgi:hypothetical protein
VPVARRKSGNRKPGKAEQVLSFRRRMWEADARPRVE